MIARQTNEVEVYAFGVVYASACAPESVGRSGVEDAVNLSHPTGISSRWRVADENFRTGEDNPHPCPDRPTHRHWLLSC